MAGWLSTAHWVSMCTSSLRWFMKDIPPQPQYRSTAFSTCTSTSMLWVEHAYSLSQPVKRQRFTAPVQINGLQNLHKHINIVSEACSLAVAACERQPFTAIVQVNSLQNLHKHIKVVGGACSFAAVPSERHPSTASTLADQQPAALRTCASSSVL